MKIDVDELLSVIEHAICKDAGGIPMIAGAVHVAWHETKLAVKKYFGQPRVERPTCKTCPFFNDYELSTKTGDCRIRSSSLVEGRRERVDGGAAVMQFVDRTIHVWPLRREDDWCAEHPAFAEWLRAAKAVSLNTED